MKFKKKTVALLRKKVCVSICLYNFDKIGTTINFIKVKEARDGFKQFTPIQDSYSR